MDYSLSLLQRPSIFVVLLSLLWSQYPLKGDEPATPNDPDKKVQQYWLTVAARHENKFGVYSFSLKGNEGQRLVVGDKPVGEPCWSPDGTRLAYVSFDQGPGQICVMDVKTQKVTRLTNSVGWERNPSWSPDGRRIAFTSLRDGGDNEIYIMDADGGNVINLTKNKGADADPTWSPDGQRIAFASQRDGHPFHLFVMNADGTQPESLSDREFTGWLFPDWSPNGKWIAVGDYQNGNVNLLLFDIHKKSFHEIADDGGCNTFARWSPDGRYVAFAHFESPPSYRAGEQVETLTLGDLMLYDGDSATLTTLGNAMVPGWGPRPCWQVRKDK